MAVAAALIAATFAISGASSAAPAGTAPTDSAAIETSVVSNPETVPDTNPDTVADTSEPSGSTVENPVDDNRSVSIGWWIGGVIVAAAAAYGIAYSLRRRTSTEEWARHASVACDIGRAASLTLIAQLDEPVWSHPARYTEQQQRFSRHLVELDGSVPDQDFPELLDAVTAAAGRLHTAVEELPDGAPITVARSTVEPAIDGLAIALDALERQASVTVFGATLPSSRTTA